MGPRLREDDGLESEVESKHYCFRHDYTVTPAQAGAYGTLAWPAGPVRP
jgi:hypothetical protein